MSKGWLLCTLIHALISHALQDNSSDAEAGGGPRGLAGAVSDQCFAPSVSHRQSFGYMEVDEDTWSIKKEAHRRHTECEASMIFPPDSQETCWHYRWHPSWTCEVQERMPSWRKDRVLIKDAGKWLCDPPRIAALQDCIVYSVGSGDLYAFEERIHEINPKCEIHVFDHTVQDPSPPNYVRFHKIGMRGNSPGDMADISDKEGNLMSLPEMMLMLGHVGKTIEVLKVDCEGCEFGAFPSWLPPVGPPLIRQILVEVHAEDTLFGPERVTSDQGGWSGTEKMMNHFTAAGYALFGKEVNNPHTGVAELSFIRLDLGNDVPKALPGAPCETSLNQQVQHGASPSFEGGSSRLVGAEREVQGRKMHHMLARERLQEDWCGRGCPEENDVTMIEQYLTQNWHPTWTCDVHERVPLLDEEGNVGTDAGMWLCNPHTIASLPSCLVYSIGPHYGAYSFEERIHQLNPLCEIHVFDHAAAEGSLPPMYVKLHRIGLKGKDHEAAEGDSLESYDKTGPGRMQPVAATTMTLPNLVAMLRHGNRSIDILSIDCAGCELEIHDTWFPPSGEIPPVWQMNIKVNSRQIDESTHPPKVGWANWKRITSLMQTLRRAGLSIFSKEQNSLVKFTETRLSLLNLHVDASLSGR